MQDQQGQPGAEGERGIGAAVLGGGAGAFLGHEMGHGKMATLGGLAVGAIAAEVFEHHHKKKKAEHRLEHAYDSAYVNGETRSRGLEDESYYRDRESCEDDERSEYEPPRHHHRHHHHDDDDGYGDRYVERDDYSYQDDYSSRRY